MIFQFAPVIRITINGPAMALLILLLKLMGWL